MKKSIYVLALAVLTLTVYSFTTSNTKKYPENLPIEYVEVLKKDFIKTIDGESLLATIETNFVSLFDEVTRIDAQHSDKSGYYYMVLGSKDGQVKFEILTVNASDIENEAYTYINFTNLDVKTAEFCTSGPDVSPFPFVCTGPCEFRTSNCLGAVCGVYIFGVCI